MKRSRLKKARAKKAAAERSRMEAGGKSRYAAKRDRANRGNFSPTSPFCSSASPDAIQPEDGDGLEILVKAEILTERAADQIRFPRPRFEDEWS